MLSEDEDTEAIETDQELLLESCEVYTEGVGTHTQPVSKRASKEIQLRELDPHDFEFFKQAIHKEWKTNIDNGAIAVIPPHEAPKIRQQQSHRIMQSRLLHVAKPIDDMSQVDPSAVLNCSQVSAPCRAKSRWVSMTKTLTFFVFARLPL